MTIFGHRRLGAAAVAAQPGGPSPGPVAGAVYPVGGFLGLLLAPTLAMGVWVAMIGLGLGACFSLSLTLTLEHLRKDPAQAGSLAAFVQGIGFIITGIIPYLTGWLRDISGDFQASRTLLTITVVAMLLVTARFAPHGYVAAIARPGQPAQAAVS